MGVFCGVAARTLVILFTVKLIRIFIYLDNVEIGEAGDIGNPEVALTFVCQSIALPDQPLPDQSLPDQPLPDQAPYDQT